MTAQIATPRHELDDETLDALATSHGGPGAVAQLIAAQHSRRLLLLRLVSDRIRPVADRDAAIAAISAADYRAPDVVRSIVTGPMAGLWAARTARTMVERGDAVPGAAGHLGALAAAVAMRTGSSADVCGYVGDGWLGLPSIGRVRLAEGSRRVRLSVAGGRLRIDGSDVAEYEWQRLRALTLDDGFSVLFDDVDPYRDVFHVPASDRLSGTEWDAWRRSMREAWRVLTAYAPERAAELAAGLHSLVPLRRPAGNAAHSATTRDAVGVVALDLPKTAADFAVALVHEFQHSKLSAVLDMVELYRSSDRLFFAPWRTDARPVGGLFHGLYAFIGVADMWRSLSADPESFPQARQEFAEARAQVSDAWETLAGSGLLTPAGERFLRGMRQAVEQLYAVAVPAATEAAAQRLLAGRRSTWTVANA
ncbi:HEXXH motif domain-containing protein [Actinoplanes sp. CA-030573]|uniref:HEXXH motif domain-containing protein n=1 Tax=Actinoplanes sp. CA-030573 TaxID=3239898 RepID=UPI003D8E3022